jgi:alkanesulfonate monooxygenase
MDLRFHWMLPKGGEVDATTTARQAAEYRVNSIRSDSLAPLPDMQGWTRFVCEAEQLGIDSMMISFSRFEPDPLQIACALGCMTQKLKFLPAYRSGLMQPTAFVQQLNTLSGILDGRVSFNLVAGSSQAEQRGYGDCLSHDQRYSRADEFLKICHAIWRNEGPVDFTGKHYHVEQAQISTPFVAPDRSFPEIYVSGHSEPALRLAIEQSSCWMRVIDTPEKLAPSVARMREAGIEVCLRLCIMCKPTREEAIREVEALLPDRRLDRSDRMPARRGDSQMYREAAEVADDDHWISHNLWQGLVPHHGPVWTTLLGTPEELADAFLEYKLIGVTQFMISGWPEMDALRTLGEKVLPLVRNAEKLRADLK